MVSLSADLHPDGLKEFLDNKADFYNSSEFVATDPVQVPHRFEKREDIEIAAFLTATISWGQKRTIINNAVKLVSLMEGGPHEFLLYESGKGFERFLSFVHRTFNGIDCIYFLRALSRIYREKGGLGTVFQEAYMKHKDLAPAISTFRSEFFKVGDPGTTARHIADITRNSAGKRVNMFLRWMVRYDGRGVDFGLWREIPMSALYIPLDVHTGTVARKLGLLRRGQDDWTAVVELTSRLREFDPGDPVRYDFALFGLGSFEKF
jgi:uncharacterized protein (TIGR02757 family)